MAFNIREFFKGLLISEENTNSPKQIEITPGGTANTKTSIVSSQTVSRTVTIPDDTTTLLGTATVQNVSNKTITTSTINSTPIGQTVPAAVSTTSLIADTADINAGTIDATTIGSVTPAASTFTAMTAATVTINGGTINATSVGATTPSTGSFSSLVATTADINGGTIDGTSIGSAVPSTGSFTSLNVAGDSVITANAAQTLKNKSLEDTTTAITDSVDPSIQIKFDAAGAVTTSTTIASSQTLNRVLTLPDATDTLVARNTTDTLTNKTLTAPVISGGSINSTAIGNVTPSTGSFTTASTTSDLTVGGNATVTGTLTVNGTTTTLNSQNLNVVDKNITVNAGGTDASSEGAGLTVARTGTSGSLIYKDLSPSKFASGPLGAETNLVNEGAAQTLTNKSLQDSTTAIVDSVDPTKQIKFDAAGTAATSTTILSSQTTDKTLTLPDATDTLVGKATTDTLTNKTLQFVQEAVATNAALTGASQTLNTITTGIVRLTNASLASLSGITAGASGQNLKIENKTGVSLSIFNENASATAADRILTGTGDTVAMAADATLFFIYDTTSSRWHLAGGSGSGSGSGEKNYILNGTAEAGTTGWVTYADAAGTRPVDGTGGSPNVTIGTFGINALRGSSSFLLNKDAVNRQGQGVSYDFTIDNADTARVLKITFDYGIVSGTFVAGSSTADSDLIVYIYDRSNNLLIEPSNIRLYSNSGITSSQYQGEFQTSSNSTAYRLIIHAASTSALAYGFAFDAVVVAPNEYTHSNNVLDKIVAYQSTGEVSATAATDNLVSLPNIYSSTGSYSVSSSAVTIRKAGKYRIKLKTEVVCNGDNFTLKLDVNGVKTSGTVHVGDNNASASRSHIEDSFIVTLATNDTVSFYLNPQNTRGYRCSEMLIEQLTGPDTQTSDQTDTRVVDMAYFKNAGVVGVGANYGSWTLGADTHGAFNTTTGNYTIPVSGDYDFEAGVSCNLTAVQLYIIKNGTGTHRSALSANGTVGFSGTLKNLVAGDVIALYNGTGSSLTVSANNTDTYFSLKRISGPASILAVETTAISYSSTNGPAIGTGATAIAFNVKDYDTHGNQYVGSTFTALASGKFRVSARYLTTAVTLTTTQRIDIFIYKNGAMYSGQQQYGNGAAGISYTAQLMDTIQLNAGDTLQIYGQSSVATSVSTAAGYSRVCIERIGL